MLPLTSYSSWTIKVFLLVQQPDLALKYKHIKHAHIQRGPQHAKINTTKQSLFKPLQCLHLLGFINQPASLHYNQPEKRLQIRSPTVVETCTYFLTRWSMNLQTESWQFTRAIDKLQQHNVFRQLWQVAQDIKESRSHQEVCVVLWTLVESHNARASVKRLSWHTFISVAWQLKNNNNVIKKMR